ncbi:hypothetical protein BGZ54_010152 [Gamsiella multidivaricata]|nr:hypothetical protein BGZ54_010152 [Gamsiella multidivaricata]
MSLSSLLDHFFSPKKNASIISSYPAAALAIPEVLEAIFSFLSRHLLRTVVCLVCREWFQIARRIAPYELHWAFNLTRKEHERVLKTLPTTVALLLSPYSGIRERVIKDNLSMEHRDAAWAEFVASIRLLQGLDTQLLREVHIRNSLTDQRFFFELRPNLSQISFLKLTEVGDRPDRVFLHGILTACPRLEMLYIDTSNFVKHRPPVKQYMEYDHSYHIKDLPVLPLRTFVVHDLVLTSRCLESLVDASPQLVEFKVVCAWRVPVSKIVPSQADNTTVVDDDQIDGTFHATSFASPPFIPVAPVFSYLQFNYAKLFRRLSRCCPRLKRLHLSVYDQCYTQDDFVTLLDQEFSAMNEWSFAQWELSLVSTRFSIPHSKMASTFFVPIPSIDEKLANRLTSLELLPIFKGSEIHGNELHHILCKTVHLRHLIAPNVLIDISLLDVHGVLYPIDSEYSWGTGRNINNNITLTTSTLTAEDSFMSTDSNPPSSSDEAPMRPCRSTWACRDLQTLHISLNDACFTEGSAPAGRIVFGYLSRICPRLVDLQLNRQVNDLSYSAGLCLLTRLHDLERLSVSSKKHTGICKENLEWIRRYPTVRERPQPPMTILSLKWRSHVAEASGNKLASGSAEAWSISTTRQSNYSDIDWTYLGLESDLEEWAKERESGILNGEQCWPQLEFFGIAIEKEDTKEFWAAERFIQEIRPQTTTRFNIRSPKK